MSNKCKYDTGINPYISASEKLESFSRHLMLILVAVIAFSASTSLGASYDLAIYLYVAGVIISMISFFAGHEASAGIIGAYLKQGDHFNLESPDSTFDFALVNKIKLRVSFQYWCTMAALVCMSISVVVSTINKDPIQKIECQISENGNVVCPLDVSLTKG